MKTFFKEYWQLIVLTLYCEVILFLPINENIRLWVLIVTDVILIVFIIRMEIKAIEKRIQKRINQIKNECND